jgi:hypothetical protein
LKEYNGFSSNERAKVGNFQLKAIQSGEYPKPVQCSLCGSTDGQMQLHNEDYSKPFEGAIPICRSCHSALHIRFTKPERWEKRKAIIRKMREEQPYPAKPIHWWETLIDTPIDINPAHTKGTKSDV